MKDEYFAVLHQTLNNEVKLNKVCSFFKMNMPVFFSEEIEERLKEFCVIKVCEVIGVKCGYNYRSGFLGFFSAVMGEAVSQKLNLNINIACPELKFVKYNHKNLINEVETMLNEQDVNEAFLEAFNFLENFKFLVSEIKL